VAQRIVHVPWDQQPQELPSVDPDHPLGRALDVAWVGGDLSGVDVLKGHKVALLSATTVGNTTRGKAFTHTGTAGSLVAVPGEATLPYVQIGYGYFNTAGGAWVLSRLGNSAGGYDSRLALASSTTVAADVRWNFGTSRTLTITLPTTLNTPICMALVAYSSSDYRFFANGQQQNGTLSPGTFVSLDRMYPPGDTLNGGMWFTGFGSGAALSDEELLRITANPESELWSMFRRRIWVPASSGGGAQTVAIGQASETDVAQALTGAVDSITALGQASETDAAQPFTATADAVAAIGQAAETDTAQALTATAGSAAAIGQASETDTAQALAAAQALAIGQAQETDTAQPVTYSAPGAIGQAQETDAAQPLQANLVQTIGQAQETDAAQSLAVLTGTTIGMALEIDTAGAFAAQQALAIGQAAEADTAQPMTVGSPGGGGTGATAAEIVALLMATEVEPGITVQTTLRVLLAAVSGPTSGLGTATERYFDPSGLIARITANFDGNSNRTSVTLDGS
jgi:hypothetical protein